MSRLRNLPARTQAVYERFTKTVRCLSHVASEEPELNDARIDIGETGASARREFERRKAGRERRAIDDPWDTGALGEELHGNRPIEPACDRLRVLHDRRPLLDTRAVR